MISNYLDGINLQMLALNDGEGKLYIYKAAPDDYLESAKLRSEIELTQKTLKAMSDQLHRDQKEKRDTRAPGAKYREMDAAFRSKLNAYEQIRKKEIAQIVNRAKVYKLTGNVLPAELPPFFYRVQFQRVRQPDWLEQFTWCDEIEIFDNQKN